MTDQATIWTAVKARYDSAGLITLTNIRGRAAAAIDDTVGTQAALDTLALWPAFTQVAFVATDTLHLEVAVRGTIAMLWERGGSSTAIAKIEWAEVFADDGLMGRVKKTGPRGRQGPSTNSGVTTTAENYGGRNKKGWSDRDNVGFMRPRDELAR